MNCSHKLQPSKVIIFYSLMQQTIIGPPFGWLHQAMYTIFYHVSVIIDRTIVMDCSVNTSALAIETVCNILPVRYTAVL